MEQEKFCSGYCRVLDRSRTVEVILEDGAFQEADCMFPDCIYASGCPVAKAIQES